MAPLTNHFLSSSTYVNVIYALNIALEEHFSELLLNSELERVIYSSTGFALRKRTREREWDDSFLPFMNYKISDISEGTDRPIWNSSAKLAGIYVPELERYVKFTPIKISYDATAWYHQHLDNLIGFSNIIWDDSSETIINFDVIVKDSEGNDTNMKLFGILGYNFSYNPTFDRNDWLEQNKIHSTKIDFSIETLLLRDQTTAYLPTETVFNFAWSKGLEIENISTWDYTTSWMDDYTNLR